MWITRPPQTVGLGRLLMVLALVLWVLALLFLVGGNAHAALRAERTRPRADGPTVKVGPPVRGMYHSAYPDFVDNEDKVAGWRIRQFERLAGKRVAWVYFSDNWTHGIRFPAKNVRIIHNLGRLPFVRLMARSTWREGGGDPVYTMQRMVAGDFDAALTRWFTAARDTGIPMMVEFGTEVNGDWFPWNGLWNGGGTTTGYGDPAVADGPERFVDAYRHLVDLSRAAGATNLTWVYHVNADSRPRKPWNTIAAYYPGDAYVDWIGVSIYGNQSPGDYFGSFRELLDRCYGQLAALSADKPLAVLEWGIAQHPSRGTKAGWIANALRWMRSGRWPRLAAASYWHEDWPNADGTRTNMRIDTSPAVRAAYRAGVASGFFTSRPVYLTP
jgi:Glycosyl hydrolase family 26